MTNIVLIGMTGSGKTTIGKELASRLKFPFIDMDDYIEEQAGQSIPELFEQGEELFRSLETDVCIKLADSTDTVISTGGGAVLKPENRKWLKQTGMIVWIDRPINLIVKDIETAHRPLLKNGTDALYTLFEKRRPIYEALADVTVRNDQSLSETVDDILNQLNKNDTKGDH
ncbi:shikimate kinase [Alkalibacterium pelagium]|uniref:Shikimate kinase n=1 Tax=Alkalibacterium pelagium TaxID=426702 RepID=A0A1H7KD94_9LACT|nr:shikimate kinase [Alkalibacterium pelagium]GEN50785.1 shikimate kinase [Alkalibacterium pelagium]SEK84779.1 shikimate kinase [Alkalibacterium pelagium]